MPTKKVVKKSAPKKTAPKKAVKKVAPKKVVKKAAKPAPKKVAKKGAPKKVVKKVAPKKVAKKAPAKPTAKKEKMKKVVRAAVSGAKAKLATQNASKAEHLIKKGKERGYITYSEILREFPHIEDDVSFLEDLYERFAVSGIDILEGGMLEDNAHVSRAGQGRDI
ncbi:RNA polymerase sigma factor region1.1 domain-containing protein [Enterococcus faecalis]|uniref:RNA polymerase sigma factor region1.1 domain-containing protein n=1 Tax=Enterococcus faecalis TaxID=1351 RepID=UPI001A98874B|nr:RNA polymerase sigma factor region1.1 domain-containing protein [Enterococcus faecalis]